MRLRPTPKTTAVLVGVMFLLFTPLYQLPVEALATSNSFDLAISGSKVMLDTSIDLCSALRYIPFSGIPSTCPFNLSIQEQYNQQLAGSVATTATFLAQSDHLTLDVGVEPNLPLASLNIEASVGNDALPIITYDVNYSATGESSAFAVNLPVQQIIDHLAQSVPSLSVLGTYVNSLEAKVTTVDKLSTGFQGRGFSGDQTIDWSTSAPQSVTVGFSGSDSSPVLGMALRSDQSWQVVFEAVVKGVPLQVGSYPVSVTFSSPAQNLFQWQRVLGMSQFSDPPGSGWYLSGSVATLSVGSTTVSLGPGERAVFIGWLGTGTGSLDSNQPSITLTADGPVNETAQWVMQDAVSLHASGGDILGATNNTWYDQGGQLKLTAEPSSGYQFKDWTMGGRVVSTSPTLPYAIESSAPLYANFISTSPRSSPYPPELMTVLAVWAIGFVAVLAVLYWRWNREEGR